MKTSILYIFLLSVLYACDSHSLLPPKQQLDQQIAQLNDYSLLSGPLNDQLCEEIETHAQEIGNDSLLLATRQIIYKVFTLTLSSAPSCGKITESSQSM